MSLLRQAERCIASQKSFRALNAFVLPVPESQVLMNAVQDAADRTSRGQRKSDIDGRLIAVKDNICTTDSPTTCASTILSGFRSPYAATVVERLQDAGAIITGKTNLDEFGMGSHSTNSSFGPVKNAIGRQDDPLSAGGSSGGSAVAVATGQCYAALGTDTGGSVRLPAAYTGIVGFKPSYGIVSRHGVVAYANSLDTVGILGRNSSNVKQVFDAIKGHDIRDPTSLSITSRSRIAEKLRHGHNERQLRIGVPLEYNIQELEADIRSAWLSALHHLQKQGHSIHQVSLPATKLALSAYYVIAPAEASSNLAKYDGVRYGNQNAESRGTENVLYAVTRGAGLGEEVKRRILLGAYSLSAGAIDNYFIQAQRVRRLVQQDFNNVFALRNPLSKQQGEMSETARVDVLLTPTAPSLPPRIQSIGHQSAVDSYRDDVLTVPASLAGLPAMSIPFPITHNQDLKEPTDDRVTGLQVIAQFGDDEMVFRVAQALEEHASSSVS